MKKAIALVAALVLIGSLGFAAAACGADENAKSAGDVPAAADETAPDVEPGATAEPASEAEPVTETDQPEGETVGGEPELMTFEVWFTRGESLVPVERVHEKTPGVGSAALTHLLDGPSEDESADGFRTAIPEGTQLLGLEIEDAVATVDLSSEFESGGGSQSMFARLGQVTCTLTQFATVEGVLFELDGEPVEVFSGEGIVLDHPVTCEDYGDLLPAITVETPREGEWVASPVTVSGTANVFEANVTVEILDSRGRRIASTFTTATCGTGCRGDYAVDVPFEVTKKQPGTIVVHDDDAAGVGRPPHTVRIAVTLLP